uniref:phosphatidylinositol 3-kinase n=1 Tax=Phallusia mammillata TaxID=59560 RepID=A0A6F9DPB9_9ASCI|nr:phosphatidylinositol 4,5-bisphosphate 3-kinase catalytic subunit gamma isoform [Phallusia mammillata]
MEQKPKYTTLKLPDVEDGEIPSGGEQLPQETQPNNANHQQQDEQQQQQANSSDAVLTVERKSAFRRSRSRLVRRNSFPKVPEGFFSVTRTMSVDFNLPNGEKVSLNCAGNHTVGQIKCEVMDRAREIFPASYEQVWEQDVLLTYTKDDKTYEICDIHQTFQTLRVVNTWIKAGMKGTLDVRFIPNETNEERLFNLKLGSLMGVIWGKYDSFASTRTDDDEVYLTRRKLTNVRRRALRTRLSSCYSMEPSLEYSTIPSHVAANLTDKNVTVCVYGPSKSCSSFSVDITSYPCNIVKEFFDSLTEARREVFGIPEEATANNYVLKVCGLNEYIWGAHEILDFSYVRSCVARRKDPQLALCEPPDESRDIPDAVHDPWYLVDDSTGVTENHQQLTLVGCKKNHTEIVAFSLWDMARKFRLKVVGIDSFSISKDTFATPDEIYVELSLYRGRQRLAEPVVTSPIQFNEDLRWFTWLEFDIKLRNIPKEARINANIIGVFKNSSTRIKAGVKEDVSNGEQQHAILSWANIQLLNHRSVLRTGSHVFKTWPLCMSEDVSVETYTGTTAPNDFAQSTSFAAELYIELDSYMHPVVFPNGGWKTEEANASDAIPEEEEPEPVHGSSEWKKLEEVIQTDPLTELTDDDKKILNKYRSYCKDRTNSLPKVLQSVDAASLDSVVQMHELLAQWSTISVEVALELLDSKYVDQKVRSLAVRTLKSLSNNKLQAYLLQLTQALKFEPYHDSALARFLLTRALLSKRIGHYFFWFLRSEVENLHVSQRYSILLEAYLRGCGQSMIDELSRQTTAVSALQNLSNRLATRMGKSGTGGSKVGDGLKDEISKLALPDRFQAPFDPRISLGRLVVDKSKIMDSKKRPVWLEFANADTSAVSEHFSVIRIIFKQGDDLRQDMLTLQMLSLMGKLWDEEGLDLHLLPYGCMSTGMQVGIIQIVPNATTVAKIQKEFGGLIRGTFKDEVLKKWLERKNPTSEKLEEAVESFMLSCAGYCVATYVLGIGDRHNDNIMVTETGNLFHIDFGHFLGNTKKFYGIQRERVPFVLTPDFAYVMGSEDSPMFQRFKDTCVHAFLVIRRHAALFINLFHMMKSTGIPELNSVRDIRYLQNVLVLDKTEQEAGSHFLAEIAGVLRKNWTVQVNWFVHRFARPGSS